MSSTATFSIDEYQRMIRCGAFAGPNAKRIELIRGELRMMSPQGAEHAELVSQLDAWSHRVADEQTVKIRVQSAIEIRPAASQPEPDLVWAKAQSYARRRPRPHEVLLLIEVAETSLAFDLGEKARLYAEAGIRDYWVFDIANRVLHVLRHPEPAGYQDHRRLAAADRVAPLHCAEVSVAVSELFACLD